MSETQQGSHRPNPTDASTPHQCVQSLLFLGLVTNSQCRLYLFFYPYICFFLISIFFWGVVPQKEINEVPPLLKTLLIFGDLLTSKSLREQK